MQYWIKHRFEENSIINYVEKLKERNTTLGSTIRF